MRIRTLTVPLALALALSLGLVGCSGGGSAPANDPAPAASTEQDAPEAPAEEAPPAPQDLGTIVEDHQIALDNEYALVKVLGIIKAPNGIIQLAMETINKGSDPFKVISWGQSYVDGVKANFGYEVAEVKPDFADLKLVSFSGEVDPVTEFSVLKNIEVQIRLWDIAKDAEIGLFDLNIPDGTDLPVLEWEDYAPRD